MDPNLKWWEDLVIEKFVQFLKHVIIQGGNDDKNAKELANKVLFLKNSQFLNHNLWLRSEKTLCAYAGALLRCHKIYSLVWDNNQVPTLFKFSPASIPVSAFLAEQIENWSVRVLINYLRSMHFMFNFCHGRNNQPSELSKLVSPTLEYIAGRLTAINSIQKYLSPNFYANVFDIQQVKQHHTLQRIKNQPKKFDNVRKTWLSKAMQLHLEFPVFEYSNSLLDFKIHHVNWIRFSDKFINYVSSLPDVPFQLPVSEFAQDYAALLDQSNVRTAGAQDKTCQYHIIYFGTHLTRLFCVSKTATKTWATSLFKNYVVKDWVPHHNLHRHFNAFIAPLLDSQKPPDQKSLKFTRFYIGAGNKQKQILLQDCCVANVCRLSYLHLGYLDVEIALRYMRQVLAKMADKDASLEAQAVKAMRCSQDYVQLMAKLFGQNPLKIRIESQMKFLSKSIEPEQPQVLPVIAPTLSTAPPTKKPSKPTFKQPVAIAPTLPEDRTQIEDALNQIIDNLGFKRQTYNTNQFDSIANIKKTIPKTAKQKFELLDPKNRDSIKERLERIQNFNVGQVWKKALKLT